MIGNNMARMVSVIEVEYRSGKGTEEDPSRPIKEYWSLEGELLAVVDLTNPGFLKKKYQKPARLTTNY